MNFSRDTLHLGRLFLNLFIYFLRFSFFMFELLIEILIFLLIISLFYYSLCRLGLIKLLVIILRHWCFESYFLTLQNSSNVFRINFLQKWNVFRIFKYLFYYSFGFCLSFEWHKVFFKFVFGQVIIL